jgi:hypothetical protein
MPKTERINFGKEIHWALSCIHMKCFCKKLEYIHWNPVKAGLCRLPEEYYYSSAGFYHTGIDNFGILTHC